MRTFIVQIRRKKRSDYPETFLVQVTSEQARDLDGQVRRLFESGKIKDFLVQDVGSVTQGYDEIALYLQQIAQGTVKD